MRLPELAPVFEQFPEVKLAYFFGSRATSEPGPLSDYDFAIYVDDPDPSRVLEIRLALLSQLQQRLGTDQVDLLVLNQVESSELKYEIVAGGILLFEREPFRVLVEPRALNEYFDFRDLLRRHGLTKA